MSIICYFLGHKYALIRKVTPVIKEVKCLRCKKEFGMHDEAKTILELDDELRYAHSIMNSVKPPKT